MADTPGRTTRGSGRRRHWKLPDMISGVRHRFRDKMRSKSPEELYLRDSLDSDAASSSNLSSTNMAYRYNGGGATLPRASSMMSTDYGFNPMEWGGVGYGPPTPSAGTPIDLTSGVSNQRVPRPPPHASDMNSRPTRHSTTSGSEHHRGGTSSSQQQHQPRLPSSGSATMHRSNPSSYEPSTTSGDYDFTSPPPTTFPTYHRGGVGRAASVSVLNQAPAHQQHPSTPLQPTSLQRGNKSVRFGENRISVFLQDSTQALEECVRLALSYAEESKARGDYHSDSEAVSLTRRLHRDPTIPEATDVNRTRSFYSDSEDQRPSENHIRDPTSVSGTLRRETGEGARVPPTPTGYRQKSFGQAVTSLDRLERLDRVRSEARSRKKRSAQINEIFSFIDKVLSGCDSGCSDDGCPLAREARRAHHGDAGIQPHHHPTRQQAGGGSSSYDTSCHNSCTNTNTSGVSYSQRSSAKKRRETSDGVVVVGHNNSSRGGGGLESDSDCDTSGTSNCSTLVRGRGRPQRGRLREGGEGEGEEEGGERRLRGRLRGGRGGGDEEEEGSRTKRDHSLKDKARTTEDVFAQIIICSELNKQRLGMPRYGHLHQKISQTVCNAIFLCKVFIVITIVIFMLVLLAPRSSSNSDNHTAPVNKSQKIRFHILLHSRERQYDNTDPKYENWDEERVSDCSKELLSPFVSAVLYISIHFLLPIVGGWCYKI